MTAYEVPEPILNSPFEEPREHWDIREGEQPVRKPGRRPAGYYYRDPKGAAGEESTGDAGQWCELALVNLLRERVKAWREAGRPGASGTTLELLQYWQRDGRKHRLFFAQLEAAETIVFLREARGDLLQGVNVPLDMAGPDRPGAPLAALRRYACKMATGTGKTTVMGMLIAWSVLNKVRDRTDARFSDAILVVCPNVTIKDRLRELDPNLGKASIYRSRDLVPPHLMADLTKGKVLVTNWHVFEPRTAQVGGVGARVLRSGTPIRTCETITIGSKSTTARGRRYLTLEDFERQVAAGLVSVLDQVRDSEGHLKRVSIETVRYVESDTALLNRVLGRTLGSKGNILVFNDEAHHAYRIHRPAPTEGHSDEEPDEGEDEGVVQEATVWMDALDRINRHRGINFCVDLSATPYYLAGAGGDTNRTFPWVVSEFGLTDAIEAGLVKIPQLAVRDSTGAEIPGYFNIWHWLLPKLTPAERGGRRGSPKPEAVLKWASTPIAMLGGLWEALRREWSGQAGAPSPVFIVICKNTKIAQVVYEWLGEGRGPAGIPPANLESLRNTPDHLNTIRVDSKVVEETDSGLAKSDEARWLRHVLDTVGKTSWPQDEQGRPLYPEGFESLARKLNRPLHPPGRDVRCIVSVGMLTEGWDCKTVTHIVGLRPFMSQLLCEQVVGRALRRTSYDPGEDGRLPEQVAKVFGVPFSVIPFKETRSQVSSGPKEHHVHAIPEKASLEIVFPRVEGYQQAICRTVAVDWASVAPLRLDPGFIPPEVDVKAALLSNRRRPSLSGPGRLERLDLNPYRAGWRLQALEFELARDLTRAYAAQPTCEVPPHVLFPQLLAVVRTYLRDKVEVVRPAELVDAFLSPYYGWIIERLTEAIRPDTSAGEVPEVPRYETRRGAGSTAEVDFWTSRPVREVLRSHINYVVADTQKWEQSAAYVLDSHPLVDAFVKNTGLGFAIPYLHNGQSHDYVPDFIIRVKGEPVRHLILETKGYDPLRDVKAQAARRWVAAVNADGSYGQWLYEVVDHVEQVADCVWAARGLQ